MHAHLVGAFALLLAVEDQPALHLAADAAQRGRRQHAFGRAAGADIHVDAGIVGIGAMDHARHVAVGDQAHRGPGAADGGNDIGVARTVEHQHGDRGGIDALRLGQPANIVGGRRVELDDALVVTGTDRDLLHVDVGRMQQRAAIGHRHGRDRARHVLGAQRGAFERIDGDIDLRAGVHADLLADEQHRRLVALALADHDGAFDRQLVELAAHRVDRGLVGLFLLAVAAQPCRRHRRALRHPHDLERQNALEQQLRRNRNMGRHRQTP